MPAPTSTVSLTELTGEIGAQLAAAHLPAGEVDIVMSQALGRSRGQIELDRLLGRAVTPHQVARIREFAQARSRRIPLQYLTGTAPFYGHEFAVGPGVFVPRPETELLVELAVQQSAHYAKGLRAIDIGSGTGVIAASFAAAVPQAEVLAYEASPHAWPWLRRNLRKLAPGVRSYFGDWYEHTSQQAAASVEMVLSNPPYVPDLQVPRDPEVRLHDPAAALYSGADGLNEIRKIATEAARLLVPGGWVIVEHTEAQGAPVRDIMAAAGLESPQTHPDLTRRDRFTSALAPLRRLD